MAKDMTVEERRMVEHIATLESELANTRAVLRELVNAVEESRRNTDAVYQDMDAEKRLDRALAAATEVME